MVTVTKQAKQTVDKIMEENHIPKNASLRLGVTTEGCEGSGTKFRYVLDFDADPAKAQDETFESEGLKIVVDKESLPKLDGMQLDVQEHFGGFAFVFRNPNAHHSCGCGHTFSDEAGAEGGAKGHGHAH